MCGELSFALLLLLPLLLLLLVATCTAFGISCRAWTQGRPLNSLKSRSAASKTICQATAAVKAAAVDTTEAGKVQHDEARGLHAGKEDISGCLA